MRRRSWRVASAALAGVARQGAGWPRACRDRLRRWRERSVAAARALRELIALLCALAAPGVMSRARRDLWRHLRADASLRREMPGGWAPPGLAWVRLAPAHAALGTTAVVVGLALAIAELWGAGLACRAEDGRHCLDRLQAITGTLLAAQVTILAVIFPIAFALVSAFGGGTLRRRPRLWLYLAETEVTWAGASGVALALACLVLLGFGHELGAGWAAAATIVVIVWFAANLLGVGVFLWRSVSFLLDEGATLRRQLASRIWPEESEPKIADHNLLSALRPGDGKAEDEVWMSALDGGADDAKAGLDRVTVALPIRMRLAEIRLEALKAVELRVQARNYSGPAPIAFAAPLEYRIGTRHEGEVTLAVASAPLTPLERWAIRRAYRFRTDRPGLAIPTGEGLLNELVSDALGDLARDDDPAFRVRCDAIAETLAFLLRLSSRRERDASLPHAGELSGGLWMLSLAQTWAHTLHPLAQRTSEALPGSARAFARIAYLPVRLAHLAGLQIVPEVVAETDKLLPFLAYRLFERWPDAVGKGTTPADRHDTAGTRPAPAAAWYDDAWRELSGAWTRLAEERWPGRDSAGDDAARSAALRDHVQPLLNHLRGTTDLVAKAAAIGDTVGGARALDLLLRWPNVWRYWRKDSRSAVRRLRDMPLAAIFETNWDKVNAPVPTQTESLDYSPEDVFVCAFRAAWRAECIDLALVLLRRAEAEGAEGAPAVLAGNLIAGRVSDPAAAETAAGDPPPPLDLPLVLGALARGASEDSQGPLSKPTLERLSRFAEARMVPGVPYRSSFGLPATEYRRQIALLLLALALRRQEGQSFPELPAAIGLGQPRSGDGDVARFFDGLAAQAETFAGQRVEDGVVSLLRCLAERHELTREDIARASRSVSDGCRRIAEAA